MLLIDVTYETVTERSASFGDVEDRGYVTEAEPKTFKEVVTMLKNEEPSCYPARGGANEWVTHDQGETRAFFERGEREFRSVHFSHENPARKQRYWALAFRAAGLTKGSPQ